MKSKKAKRKTKQQAHRYREQTGSCQRQRVGEWAK